MNEKGYPVAVFSESDKLNLIAWANRHGYTISTRSHPKQKAKWARR